MSTARRGEPAADGPVNVASRPAGRRASATRAFHLTTHDFDEFALAFANWDAEFRQLSRGTFSGRLQVLRAGAVEVLRVQGNQLLHARGSQRRPRWMFTLVEASNEGANWRGRQLRPGQINLLGPREEMDHRSAPAFNYLSLNVNPEPLREAAATLHRVDVSDWLRGRVVLTPAPPAQARLEAKLRRLLGAAGRQTADPSRLQEAGAVEADCLRLLLDAVLGSGHAPAAEERGWWQRRAAACRAVEYMEAHLHRPRSVRELCAELDVSERTLETAFREQFGLGPLAYYKARRLNAVREQLKQATLAVTPLHAVARRWGFLHPGAFAADYRRLFGELPSQTVRGARRAVVGLARPATDQAAGQG